jgi:hypothetical protein
VRNMRSIRPVCMADCSQEQTIFCLNVIPIFKGLLFLIYAPHQYFTHYGSAYVQLKRHSNFNNTWLISKGLFFFDTPCIEGYIFGDTLYRVSKKTDTFDIQIRRM